MSGYETPKFESFSTSSTEKRRWVDRSFYLICVAVSVLSVVVLVILLTSILVAALPVFGPHPDRYESNQRLAVVQGTNEGNDSELIDAGDLIQGVFEISGLNRGGLGKSNDLEFGNGGVAKIGIYSFEVGETIATNELETLISLQSPSAGSTVCDYLAQAGIEVETTAGSSIAIVSSDTAEIDLARLSFDGEFVGQSAILQQISGADNWTVDLLLGVTSDSDFGQLRLQNLSADSDGPPIESLSAISKLRANKTGGQLNCLLSILGGDENQDFKPIRLRDLGSNELVEGQAKIDANNLTGLSRRKKKGFQFGGELELVYCPIPESDASAFSHAQHFLTGTPKSEPSAAGIGPALLGSLWVVSCCVLFALPIGIGTAIFLEEFKPTNRFLLFLHGLIQLNISNLAGVPSIVYGILGLTAFASMTWMFGNNGNFNAKNPYLQAGADHYIQYLTEGENVAFVPIQNATDTPKLTDGMLAESSDGQSIELNVIDEGEDYPTDDSVLARSISFDAEGGLVSRKSWWYLQLPFGRGVLAASLTLMLVILPVIIISTQEALRAVPNSLREGALGLGTTQWQVVQKVTLPAAIPSIMTGAILSVSRAIGEAAPILILCGVVFLSSGPQHLMDEYSVLPIQIYYWAGEPVDRVGAINYQNIAAAGIVVLLAILLTFNAVAVLIRQFTQKPLT